MNRAALSVVIVTYNSAGTLGSCLASLMSQLEDGDEVYVVDNASSDGGPAYRGPRAARIQTIRNGENIGFARACNQAMALAGGAYVLLLNPDTKLDPGAIATAIGHLESNPRVGVLGGRVLLENGCVDPAAHRSFKSAGTYFYKALGLARLFPGHPRFGRYYQTHRRLDQVTEVDSVVGAFLLIRRQAVEAVGLLDERFFMYCEDEDWCWRVKRAGWQVVYHPGVVLRHQKGSSARQAPLRTLYHWHRSTYLYHRKNIAPGLAAPVNLVVYAGLLAAMVARMGGWASQRLLLGRKQTLPQSQSGAAASRSWAAPEASRSWGEYP